MSFGAILVNFRLGTGQPQAPAVMFTPAVYLKCREIGVVLTIFSKYFLGGISTSIKVDNFSTLGVVGFGIFLFSLNLAVLIVFLKILDGLLVGTYRVRVVR